MIYNDIYKHSSYGIFHLESSQECCFVTNAHAVHTTNPSPLDTLSAILSCTSNSACIRTRAFHTSSPAGKHPIQPHLIHHGDRKRPLGLLFYFLKYAQLDIWYILIHYSLSLYQSLRDRFIHSPFIVS